VDEATALRVCDRCRQSGWLSDERVAQRTVELSTKRHLGKLRVEQEMEQRQVAPEAQAQVLEELNPESELDRALAALSSYRAKKRTPQSAARWLAGRGFEAEVVIQAVERALGPLEPE
jgi:SOS response regulatory protein OraA/RecX